MSHISRLTYLCRSMRLRSARSLYEELEKAMCDVRQPFHRHNAMLFISSSILSFLCSSFNLKQYFGRMIAARMECTMSWALGSANDNPIGRG